MLEDRLSVLHSVRRLQGAASIPGQATSIPRQGAPKAANIPGQGGSRGREHSREGEDPRVMNMLRQGPSRGGEHPGMVGIPGR